MSSSLNPEAPTPSADLTMEELARIKPEVHAELETVFAQTSQEQLTQETGLGLNELSQIITFEGESGTKTGTLAAAISEPDCPAGKMVRRRYERGGLAKVEDLFHEWKEDGLNIDVRISSAARQREQERLARVTQEDTLTRQLQLAESKKK